MWLHCSKDDATLQNIQIPILAGNTDDEGTLNVTYLSGATPAQLSRVAELYPQDPAQGSPFGTGPANQVTVPVSKHGKSMPELGAYHPSDIPLFFPTNTTVPTDNVAVDALVNFLNTLDPNRSAAPKSHYSNPLVFWPKWQTPSTEGSTSLLTFSDPAVVNITADNFRAKQIKFLIDLHVEGVSFVGL
ncbi:hypothetical protein C8R44DRAFT_747295 [Mycena epipterygia]|nr:hypothetical protein C8R44DRAFT_747295 [Mycena epipterygia]